MPVDDSNTQFFLKCDDGTMIPIATENGIHDYPESTDPETVEVTTLSDRPCKFLNDCDCNFTATVHMSQRDNINFNFLAFGRGITLFYYQYRLSNNWLRKHGLPMRRGEINEFYKKISLEQFNRVMAIILGF